MSAADGGRDAIRNALDAFINSLRQPVDGRPITWLADEIEQQLAAAEADARREWRAARTPSDTPPDHFLSDSQQLEIAMRTAHHYLVVLPGMWAHVRRFWSVRKAQDVVLYPEDSDQPFELDPHEAEIMASAASEAIIGIVSELHKAYPNEVGLFSWLFEPAGEGHDHQ